MTLQMCKFDVFSVAPWYNKRVRQMLEYNLYETSGESRNISLLSSTVLVLWSACFLEPPVSLHYLFFAPRFRSSLVFISLDFSINQACFMAHWPALGPKTFIWAEGKQDNPQHQQRIRYNQQERGTALSLVVQWLYYRNYEMELVKQWNCCYECKFVDKLNYDFINAVLIPSLNGLSRSPLYWVIYMLYECGLG